jgi:hypothetical protein
MQICLHHSPQVGWAVPETNRRVVYVTNCVRYYACGKINAKRPRGQTKKRALFLYKALKLGFKTDIPLIWK